MLETLPCLWNFWLLLGKKCIFQQFLPLMRHMPYIMALPNCRCIIESWQISCRYVYVLRKLNSINTITHNLSLWSKIECFLCKMRFCENQFYKGTAWLWFTKTKIVMDRIDGIWFSKNLNISTWNLPTFYDTPTFR